MIVAGLVLTGLGLLLTLGGKVPGLGRLPGDIVIERGIRHSTKKAGCFPGGGPACGPKPREALVPWISTLAVRTVGERQLGPDPVA